MISVALVSLSILAFSLGASAGAGHGADPPKVFCDQPRTLRLHRFEDHSARLECGGRVIARVSVPG